MIALHPIGRRPLPAEIIKPAHPLRRGMLAQLVITQAGVHDRVAVRQGSLRTKAGGRNGYFGAISDGSSANGVEYNTPRLNGLSSAGNLTVAWQQANVADSANSIWTLSDQVWNGVCCYGGWIRQNSNGNGIVDWTTPATGTYVYTQTSGGTSIVYRNGARTPIISATGRTYDAVTLTRIWMLKNPYLSGVQAATTGATINNVTVWDRALSADEAVLWMNTLGQLQLPHPGRRSVLLSNIPSQNVAPAGIAPTAAFGTPAVDTIGLAQGAIADGIAPTAAMGSPTVATVSRPAMLPVAPTAAFGTPSLDIPGQATLVGIAPTTAVGIPAVNVTGAVALAGIGPGTTFGAPSVATVAGLAPAGIAGTEGFGAANVTALSHLDGAAGIAPTAGFGTPTLATSAPPGETSEGYFDDFFDADYWADDFFGDLGGDVPEPPPVPTLEPAADAGVLELVAYRAAGRVLLKVPTTGRYAPTRRRNRQAFVGLVDAVRVAGVHLDAGQYVVRTCGRQADQAIILTPDGG